MKPEDVEQALGRLPTIPRVYPEAIYNTVNSIIDGKRVGSVLDYAAIPQSFIFRVVDRQKPELAIACPVDISYEDQQLLNLTMDYPTEETQPNHCIGAPLRWVTRSSLGKKQYDAVLGVLDSLSELEQALRHLSPDGIGIFHVHTFFFRGLSRLGPLGPKAAFYIQGALAIPTGLLGTLFLEEFASEYLLILNNAPSAAFFVARLSEDAGKNEEVLANMKRRAKGRTLDRGLLTNIEYASMDDFRYWSEARIAENKIEFSHRASEVLRDVLFTADDQAQDGETNSVAFRLPDSDAVGTGYVRVLLDESRILADYLRAYMEEALKHRTEFVRTQEDMRTGLFGTFVKYDYWLDRCASQSEILHRIMNTWILLPELQCQKEIVRLQAKFNDVTTYADMLRKKMWTEPEAAATMEHDIPVVNQADIVRLWISRLPHPLATVLWAYHALADPKEKIEHLFYFLETLAEFSVTVMLSAACSDRKFLEMHLRQWEGSRPEDEQWLLNPGMGTWVHLGTRISGFFRKILTKPDEEESVLRLFGNAPRASVEAICDAELWSILRTGLGMRNTWKGHSGKPSPAELAQRLEKLTLLANRIRSCLSDRLSPMKFVVRREETAFKGGIHTYRVWSLEGTAMPFPEEYIQTRTAMETGEIYMVGSDCATPTKVLPLIRLSVEDGSEAPTVYFYNRLEEDSMARYVSYSSQTRSEILVPVGNIRDVLGCVATTKERLHSKDSDKRD